MPPVMVRVLPKSLRISSPTILLKLLIVVGTGENVFVSCPIQPVAMRIKSPLNSSFFLKTRVLNKN